MGRLHWVYGSRMAAVEVPMGECIFSLFYDKKLIFNMYFPTELKAENSEKGIQNVTRSIYFKLWPF